MNAVTAPISAITAITMPATAPLDVPLVLLVSLEEEGKRLVGVNEVTEVMVAESLSERTVDPCLGIAVRWVGCIAVVVATGLVSLSEGGLLEGDGLRMGALSVGC